jgi:uncharacterized damage-inducible protein DinB
MFHTLREFAHAWEPEIEKTQKILKHLTNESLTQAFTPEGRTLGRLGWHITTTIPEMMNLTGLEITEPDPQSPVPATAKEIFNGYNTAAIALLDQVNTRWTDETLKVVDDMYGERWTRAATLECLISHQIHHRGQMTVLMRLAGLRVPGLFGPAREEWAKMGMKPPVV